MGYLSIPYRVMYESRAFRTGLQDVTAMVKKPDGEVVGPFHMSEMESPFNAIYAFDYPSRITDRPGEHSVVIFSPTEDIRTAYRMSLYIPPPGTAPIGTVEEALVVGRVIVPNSVRGVVLEDLASATVIENDQIDAGLPSGEYPGIEGILGDDDEIDGGIDGLP